MRADHPNLQLAAQRLRRILWTWAALFAGMGLLAFFRAGPDRLAQALPWLAAAALLAISRQPALLALAAVIWGLSMVGTLPQPSGAPLPDPLSSLLGEGVIERLALVLARVLLMITAWNQFMFYRLLYGSAGASGLDPELPPIPEVIENRSDRLAWVARLIGVLALAFTLLALPLAGSGLRLASLDLALGGAWFAIGLGAGAAFSPTRQRRIALTGGTLGVAAFLLAVTLGRLTAG
jgi:hypothetical protein